jgi:hypothetical protein
VSGGRATGEAHMCDGETDGWGCFSSRLLFSSALVHKRAAEKKEHNAAVKASHKK